VDSNSTDNSINIARNYPCKIIQVSGEVNAAIGRNEGVRSSKGEVLFLIDGDMELIPGFHNFAFNPDSKNLNYPFINGYLCHKIYDDKFIFIKTICEKILNKPIFRNVTGGLMIVKRKFWEEIGGMDERLIRNQDLDFGLRMSKIGIKVKLLNELIAYHHTCEYFYKNRAKYFYLSKALLSAGLLMRKHLIELTYLKIFYQQVLNVLILISFFITLFLNFHVSLVLLISYFLIQLIRTLKSVRKERFLFRLFLYKFLFNFYCLVGLLFFFPDKPRYVVTHLTNS
jgi:glycosyltransferase involved in cell wall biosynthesis